MSGCKICGTEENLQYQCNYCGNPFCSTHRLPEKHDCPGLTVLEEVDTSWLSGDRDLSKLQSDDVDVPDSVIESIEGAPSMNTRSKAVRDQKAREVVDMLSDAAEVSDGNVVIGEESDSKPYETIEPGTVGTSIDPDYASSPGMNPDGSLKESEVDDLANEKEGLNDESQEGIPPLSRLLFTIIILVVIGAVVYVVFL